VTGVVSQNSNGVGDAFSSLSFTAWDAVLALAIVVAAWLLSRLARRATARLIARVDGVSDDLRNLGARVAGYTVLFIGVGVGLSILGAQIQPVLVVAILFGVVIVLALRGIADNFAAGIVIQTRRPLHLGDEIDALGFVGVVRELNSRAVVIRTLDGRTAHLPNHQLLDGPIVNHTTAAVRRSEVEVRVAVAGDETSLAELLSEAVATVPGVLDDPGPGVVVTAAEPERTTATVRFWHSPTVGVTVTSSVVVVLAQRLRAAGHTATVLAPPPAAPLTPRAPL